MYIIDRPAFFDAYRKAYGRIPQQTVDALELLLGYIEHDEHLDSEKPVTQRQKLAYFLGTVKWETAHSFQPIDEIGDRQYFEHRYGHQTAIGQQLGNTYPGDGALFHGRGYVQLTGKANYRRIGETLNLNLINKPELAKQPEHAYQIALRGMEQGWFTGKKFGNYFTPNVIPDWKGARRIINGTDMAATIANIAIAFDAILSRSLTTA